MVEKSPGVPKEIGYLISLVRVNDRQCSQMSVHKAFLAGCGTKMGMACGTFHSFQPCRLIVFACGSKNKSNGPGRSKSLKFDHLRDLWQSMAIYGNLWIMMNININIWISWWNMEYQRRRLRSTLGIKISQLEAVCMARQGDLSSCGLKTHKAATHLPKQSEAARDWMQTVDTCNTISEYNSSVVTWSYMDTEMVQQSCGRNLTCLEYIQYIYYNITLHYTIIYITLHCVTLHCRTVRYIR